MTIDRAVSKSLLTLPPKAQGKIQERIKSLRLDPQPQGSQKLAGFDTVYRVRVGEYRIVYKVEDARLVILVIRVGHRKDVYWDM